MVTLKVVPYKDAHEAFRLVDTATSEVVGSLNAEIVRHLRLGCIMAQGDTDEDALVFIVLNTNEDSDVQFS